MLTHTHSEKATHFIQYIIVDARLSLYINLIPTHKFLGIYLVIYIKIHQALETHPYKHAHTHFTIGKTPHAVCIPRPTVRSLCILRMWLDVRPRPSKYTTELIEWNSIQDARSSRRESTGWCTHTYFILLPVLSPQHKMHACVFSQPCARWQHWRSQTRTHLKNTPSSCVSSLNWAGLLSLLSHCSQFSSAVSQSLSHQQRTTPRLQKPVFSFFCQWRLLLFWFIERVIPTQYSNWADPNQLQICQLTTITDSRTAARNTGTTTRRAPSNVCESVHVCVYMCVRLRS